MKEKSKKVGIITLHGYSNYGNRLQAYATQKVIKTLGFDAHILIIKNISNENRIINGIIKLSKVSIKEIYGKIFDKINRKITYFIAKNSIKKREKMFKDFSKKHLVEIYCRNTKNSLKCLSDRYDFFITGSDQVWNPLCTNSFCFLEFTDKNKRIAYAPSFGVSDIPDKQIESFRYWLSGMKNISVREATGRIIVKKIIGKDVIVLIDPTLMLSREEWLSVSKEVHDKPQNGYILTYFLGKLSKKNKSQIKRVAAKKGLRIINMNDSKNKKVYETGPSEFIDYVDSASILFTDSFHGVIFSILLKTPFVVFERNGSSKSMFSRIDMLLKIFKLEHRNEDNLILDDKIFDIDFSHIPFILEFERKKAINYLKNSLNRKNK